VENFEKQNMSILMRKGVLLRSYFIIFILNRLYFLGKSSKCFQLLLNK